MNGVFASVCASCACCDSVLIESHGVVLVETVDADEDRSEDAADDASGLDALDAIRALK
jgi:hypothetical protein